MPDLTPAEALGVVLSTGVMSTQTLGAATAEAVPALAHLAAMGWQLVPIEVRRTHTDEEVMPVLEDVRAELARAERKHRPMHSPHDGYATILEEMDELWDEVKAQNGGRNADARHEAIQVAAMGVRYVLDVIREG